MQAELPVRSSLKFYNLVFPLLVDANARFCQKAQQNPIFRLVPVFCRFAAIRAITGAVSNRDRSNPFPLGALVWNIVSSASRFLPT